MTSQDHCFPYRVYAVLVSYQPDDVVQHTLEAIATQVERVIVVDNNSDPHALRLLKRSTDSINARLISLSTNTGIAHAQNIGIKIALNEGADYVLLLDQDSVPATDMVQHLVHCFLEYETWSQSSETQNKPLAAIGPLIHSQSDLAESDAQSNADRSSLVYVNREWSPGKAHPEELAQPIIEVAFLLASGSLLSRQALIDVGPMNEAYFIDHVDMEWCLRAKRKGYVVCTSTTTELVHSFGDRTMKIPFTRRQVHIHSPLRGYYVTRNTIALCSTSLMPPKWRIRYMLWLLPFTGVNVLFTGQPRERLTWALKGVRDAIDGRTGRVE